MEMIEGWNGASACMLQAALRMSNEAFAAHLGVSVRAEAGSSGAFIDPAEGVRSSKDVEVKWGIHPLGDKRVQWTADDQCTPW